MRVLLALLILALPIAVSAQEDVRAQIRAELRQDPSTANLSAEELELLVSALAAEAESTPEGVMYLDAQTAPTFVYEEAPVATPSPILSLISTPIVIAVAALFAGMLLLVLFLLRHRHSGADLQNG